MEFLSRLVAWFAHVFGGLIVAMIPMFVSYVLALRGMLDGWLPTPIGTAFFILGAVLPFVLMDAYLAVRRGQSLRAYWVNLRQSIRGLPSAVAHATTRTLRSLVTVLAWVVALALLLVVLGWIGSALAGAPGWALVIIALLLLIWLK